MTKLQSLLLAAVAMVALAVTPVFAQNTPMSSAPAPMASPPPAAAPAPMASPAPMQPGMKMPMAKAKPKAKKPMKMAKEKLGCGDYAWQSQDQKDCEAGKIKPPNWR